MLRVGQESGTKHQHFKTLVLQASSWLLVGVGAAAGLTGVGVGWLAARIQDQHSEQQPQAGPVRQGTAQWQGLSQQQLASWFESELALNRQLLLASHEQRLEVGCRARRLQNISVGIPYSKLAYSYPSASKAPKGPPKLPACLLLKPLCRLLP